MTDIKLVQDEFGRNHPVKVEDLFQYGIESDGDSIATGVVKAKHFNFYQPKNADNVGTGYVCIKTFTLPEGAIVYRYGIYGLTDNAWTVEGSPVDAYVNIGTPDNYQELVDSQNVGEYYTNSQAVGSANSLRATEWQITVYGQAEHPDYVDSAGVGVVLYYTVPVETIGSDSNQWVID